MLTRREFVGAAASLSAAAARAAPLPDEARRQPGIVVNTWDGCVLFLNEAGLTTRSVRYRPPTNSGVEAHAVSRDGRTAAVLGPLIGRPGDPNPLVGHPLTDRPVPRSLPTPAQFVNAWSGDGTTVVGSHFSSGFTMGGEFRFRTFVIDVASGRCTDLGMPEARPADGGFPDSPYLVQDWSADGRWFLARRCATGDHPRPFTLVPAGGGAFQPLDLDPKLTWTAWISPDSRRLRTVRAEPGREAVPGAARQHTCVVEVRPLHGGAATEVGRWLVNQDDVGIGVGCRWRADGRRVVVLAQRRGGWNDGHGSASRPIGELVTLDPDGGNRRVVRTWVGSAPFRLLGWA